MQLNPWRHGTPMAKTININDPNIPLVGPDGQIDIILSRDSLWKDDPLPPGYDRLQSTLEFLYCVREEVQLRYPRAQIKCMSQGGDDPAGVYCINMRDANAFHTVARLIDDLERNRRHEWLIKEGDDARGTWKKTVDEEGKPLD
jgi:hypothetical protein